MKKLILLLSVLFTTYLLNADNLIPNNSFENWKSDSYSSPTNYPYSSSLQAILEEAPVNMEKTTDAYHGQYAVKLMTIPVGSDSFFGYFINTDPGEGNTDTWKNGIPYDQIPTGIKGYYKYNVETVDSALVMAIFRKNGTTIGNYTFKIGGIKNDYTLFEFELNPALTEAPDSLIFGAVSSNFLGGQGSAGSTLYIDNVSFTGVSSQPALLNGDFEDWSVSELPFFIEDWNPHRKGENGVARTTDAKEGTYAIELTSYLGEEDGTPRTLPGYLTLGYWDKNCNCNMGGIPFTNVIDTLTFWYKYAPVSTDNAEVNLNFKKNGINFDGRNIYLSASDVYKYAEIPFNINMTPDSVIINITSTLWSNNSVAHVGSKLIIDNLNFKSQMGTSAVKSVNDNANVKILPTNTNGLFILKNKDSNIQEIKIINSTGALVQSITNLSGELDLRNLPKGMYIISFISKSNTQSTRILNL